MSAPQPLLHSAIFANVHPGYRRTAFLCVAVLIGTLLFSGVAGAQVSTPLVTLVTDQTPLNLSNHFGVPVNSVVNQAGDYAFVGTGGSALFLRRAGASTTRLLQFGDPVPNIAGSSAVSFILGGLNSSAHLLFTVDYNVSPPDGQLHRAVILYNGSTYSTVATSDQFAPGAGGQKFGPVLGFIVNGGNLNDHDDVAFTTTFEPFAGTFVVPNQNTLYIAPAAGVPVRVVGLGDMAQGVPGPFASFSFFSPINALGQVLINAQFFTGATNVTGLFLVSTSAVIKVVATGDSKPVVGGTFAISNANTGQNVLNNSGQVAFLNSSSPQSVWLYSGGSISNTYPGTAGTTVLLSALSDIGNAVGIFTSVNGQSVVRIHSNLTIDTVASTGQPAPGSGGTFSSFFSFDQSIANDDRITFSASFSPGGFCIYQQTGTGPAQPIAIEGQTASLTGGETLNPGFNPVTKALNNGSTFFSAAISGGTANYAQFLGTPGNLVALMSTADTLPAGARVRLSQPASNSGNNSQEFIAFAANLTGGQTTLFVKEIFSGVITRIVGDGDTVSGFGSATIINKSAFFMNRNGKVAFSASLTGNSGAILMGLPFGGAIKVAASGDVAPVTGNPFFTGFSFSSSAASLSPINDSGQVGFYGNLSTGSTGIFIGIAGGGVAKIAALGDTVPEGGGTFTTLTGCSLCSLAVNANGQVVFGANKTGGSGIYTGFGNSAPAKVVASGDTRPVIGGTFGLLSPISGFNDFGQVVFEAVSGGGVFLSTGGIVTAVAVDGAANPGAGGGILATSTPAFPLSAVNTTFNNATNAAIDNSGSVVFQSRVTGANGGIPDSGYFRVQNNGGTFGPLQSSVLQGQVVPNVGTLGTIFPSFFNNSFFLLSSGSNTGGEITFTNSFTNAGSTKIGQFISIPTVGVQKVMVPGDPIPGTGGGVYASSTTATSQGQENDTRVYEVLTGGGSASQAIVLIAEQGGTVPTTTALISSLNPSGIGEPVTFTATVTSAGGTPLPGDVVAFFDNGVAMGAGSLDGNGQATFTALSLSTGTHAITAQFFSNSGDNNNTENFASSISAPLVQVVSNDTTTLLFSLTNPSSPGQSVTFEVLTFSPVGGGTPSGTITFFDGAAQIGSPVPLSGGFVIFSTSSLSAGSHSITAHYSGDVTFTASTSSPVIQVVQQNSGLLPSAIALASSANPSVTGQPVTFIAPVNGPAGGSPTGTVSFEDSGEQIGVGTIAAGQATFTTSALTAGSHSIMALYTGNANFSPSISNVVTQQVNGSGASPLSTTPSALIFGPQSVGTTSATQNVTLTAAGGATATLIELVVTEGDFTQTNDCPGNLPSGGTCHIAVSFTPNATGPRTGQLTIFSSDEGSPHVVNLTGNSALRNLPGFLTNSLPANDDDSTGLVPLGFAANFFGTNYTGVFVNNNGNITFDSALGDFTPFPLTTTSRVIMAPFFADVDTEGLRSGLVTYGTDTVNGHPAFAANWNHVGYCCGEDDKLNTFQVVLINRSDLGAGNLDVEFNYDQIQWETGDASNGVGGLGGSSARVGYSNGTLVPGTFFELPGSAVNGSFLDSNQATGLIYSNSNTSVPGRILFQIRNGAVVGADLAVSMGHAPDPLTIGDNETFTTTITNNGPADASGVLLTNAIPAGSTFFSVTSDQGNCIVTNTVTCSLGSLASGASTKIALVVTATTQGTITNTATVNSSTADPIPQNNVASQTATVNGPTLFPTATTLVSSVNPSTPGQGVTFTATVTESAAGTPTGIVTFFDNTADTQIGTGTLDNNGQTTFSTSSLSVGSHSVTAHYLGDTNFATSTSNPVTQVVQVFVKPSSTVLASSLNPAAFGQPVTFTAIVFSTAGGTPTGTVRFLDNNVQFGTGTLDANGQTTFSSSSLSLGLHSITAQYTGDANFGISTSVAVSQMINHGPTATAILSSLNPSLGGQTVQFSAIVTSSTGQTPTGTVTFFDGATNIGTGILNASGVATFSTSTLSVGVHTLTAQYPSGAIFNGSTSTILTQTVTLNSTSTSLVSSVTPSQVGQNITLTAKVLGSAGGAPTGNVTFFDNTTATQLGTSPLSAGGQATFSTSSLSLGSHSIIAQYAGDPNFGPSASAPITQVIQGVLSPSSTVLTSSLNPAAFGQSVTFTAIVFSTAGGTPTGTVRFLDNNVQFGTGTLDINGQATFSISTLSLGVHSITAQYAGDANFVSSTSLAVSQMINHGPTTTAIISSVNPSFGGQSVQFSAIVTSSTGQTPTGTVTFLDGATTIGTGILNGSGIATFSTSALSAGTHSITAQYPSGAIFNGSVSTILTQSVTPNLTSTAIGSSLNPSVGAQTVQFSAIVTAATGGTPTGIVNFLDNNIQIGSGSLNASGVATFTTSSLSVGTHTITAQYPSGPIFTGSTSSVLTQTVTLNLTSTSLISSLNPSPSTTFVQFSAIVTSSTGTPVGTVTFLDNNVQIASSTVNASGVATFGTSTLSIGNHPITAQYVGNSSFGGSTSAIVNQSVTINATPTTTPTFISISSSPNPAAVGQAVLITATASSSTSGTLTGNVTFLDNGTPIGVSALNGAGIATFSTASLTSGIHPLTAQYSGDANFASSKSSVLSQTVGSGSSQVTIQITPIPTNVAPRSTCPSGGYCQQFGATVQNAGTNPSVTWQVLNGPGSIDSTGNYTAPPSVTQGTVTISAAVGNSSASVAFVLGPDALTTSQPPASVAAGTPLSVPVQLTGVPTSSVVPFTLSCGSLPTASSCQFTNTSTTPPGCPMGTITFVTGACPNFTVTVITSSGGTASHLVPQPPDRPGTPWYVLFAIILPALSLLGRRGGIHFERKLQAYCVLVLLCVSVTFLVSCSGFAPAGPVSAPTAVPLTPSGSYQVVVLATPQSGAGGGFVQTQLIVPIVIK